MVICLCNVVGFSLVWFSACEYVLAAGRLDEVADEDDALCLNVTRRLATLRRLESSDSKGTRRSCLRDCELATSS